MMPMRPPRFIGEAIRPDPATFDTGRMAAGEPGLPRRFVWRDQTLEVTAVLRSWRVTGPCRHGSGERYVRRHCYEVRLSTGAAATLCFERQPRQPRTRAQRWRLLDITGP